MSNDSVNAQDEIRRIRILCWLAEQGRGKYSIRTFAIKNWNLWPKSLINKKTIDDMKYLAAKGWIEDEPTWDQIDPRGADISRILAGITDAGRSKAQDLQRVRTDKPSRAAACRASVLWWLYSHDAVRSGRSLSERDFFEDKNSVYGGGQFSHDELLAAYTWLRGRGLVAGPDPDDAQRSIYTYLTDEGVLCVDRYEGQADNYLEAVERQQSDRSRGPVINIHGGQVQMATGDYAQQTMSVGLATEQLVLVIQGLAEMIRGFQLDSGQEAKMEKLQHDAVADVISPRPSGNAVRRFYDWVLECLTQGASAAVSAAITAAANGMLHDAEQLTHTLGM
jgi:hypothetical protein